MTTPLIPRTKLFGNPTRAQGRISPDGRWLSWLAPQGRRAQHLDRAGGRYRTLPASSPTTASAASAFTAGPTTAFTSSTCRTRAAPRTGTSTPSTVETGEVRDLTPLQGSTPASTRLCLDEPGIAAVAINDRDKAWHDLYRVDIATGERELLFANRDELSDIVLDRQLRPMLATRSRAREGGSSIFRIDGAKLEPIGVVEHEDDLTTRFHGFTRDGGTLYRLSSIGRDKAALIAIDWQSGDGAGAGRASQGRHLARARASADPCGGGGRRRARDARLDCPQRGHRPTT